jgi:DNA recombination protein RmuC
MLGRRKTEMILALLALQILLVVLIACVLWRHRGGVQDPAIATLAAQVGRLDAYVRESTSELRRQGAEDAARARAENADAAAGLRGEVIDCITKLGTTLSAGLDGFRGDNQAAADKLRAAMEEQMIAVVQRLSASAIEMRDQQITVSDSIHGKLTELMNSNGTQQERLRGTVEERLNALNTSNAAKLEEMRVTVDEKLHATLQTRLTESFGQVTDQLTKVHAGLGEMSKLSSDVGDLSRLFTNVRSRGQIGEKILGDILEDMLAPNQFDRNAQVKPGTQECVEFAVRLPSPNGVVLLPIDSKFPRESWDRLVAAYESAGDISAGRKSLESAIRAEAKRISSKYIHEPDTTPIAVMFLPTEGLYAEITRLGGLCDEVHKMHKVIIAGPSNLTAILTSFRMVFQLVNLQKKGSEVWKVLAGARTEFGKFGTLMETMDRQVGTVQNTIRELGTRTRAINKSLRDVGEDDAQPELAMMGREGDSGYEALLPALAAMESE